MSYFCVKIWFFSLRNFSFNLFHIEMFHSDGFIMRVEWERFCLSASSFKYFAKISMFHTILFYFSSRFIYFSYSFIYFPSSFKYFSFSFISNAFKVSLCGLEWVRMRALLPFCFRKISTDRWLHPFPIHYLPVKRINQNSKFKKTKVKLKKQYQPVKSINQMCYRTCR